MSEVALYHPPLEVNGILDIVNMCRSHRGLMLLGLALQGYLAHQKMHPPGTLGSYRRPMSRVLGGSLGGGHFLMGQVHLYRRTLRRCVSAIPRKCCNCASAPTTFPPAPRVAGNRRFREPWFALRFAGF